MHSAVRGYLVQGDLDAEQVDRIACELLADSVVERTVVAKVGDAALTEPPAGAKHLVYVLPKPGVMDPVAMSAKQAIAEKKVPIELWRRVEKAIEIDRNLRNMQQAGIDAVYHVCDVSDRKAMTKLLDEIRRTDGPLEGIIHGAGIERACRFTKKDPEMVSRTIAAKVDGAAVLMDPGLSPSYRLGTYSMFFTPASVHAPSALLVSLAPQTGSSLRELQFASRPRHPKSRDRLTDVRSGTCRPAALYRACVPEI